jgi:hypothetical protein
MTVAIEVNAASHLSPAQSVIFNALHISDNKLSASEVANLNSAHWGELLALSQSHRLGPLLYQRFKKSDVRQFVPDAVLEILCEKYKKNGYRNLNIYSELVKLTKLLNQANISSIALKGAYLARFAYPDANLRSLRDLDLLVPESDAQSAYELLLSQGYRTTSHGHAETHAHLGKHLPMLISPQGIHIEIHLRLITPFKAEKFQENNTSLDWDALWSRGIERDLLGTKLRFLSPEDLLLHLCLHATVEHYFDVGPSALTDIAYLLENHHIDWDRFTHLSTDTGWISGVLPALDMAKRRLGAAIPTSWLSAIGAESVQQEWRDAADLLIFVSPQDYKPKGSEKALRVVFSHGHMIERVGLLLRGIFAERALIARDYPVKPNSPLVFLYYPLRWWRLISQGISNLSNYSNIQSKMGPYMQQRAALEKWLTNSAQLEIQDAKLSQMKL